MPDDKANVEAIKHPEKMGPLGDSPDHPKGHARRQDQLAPSQEEAETADREQLTTQE